jgi:hypothetical protein
MCSKYSHSGEQSVGKTSIITRFMYDTFDSSYQVGTTQLSHPTSSQLLELTFSLTQCFCKIRLYACKSYVTDSVCSNLQLVGHCWPRTVQVVSTDFFCNFAGALRQATFEILRLPLFVMISLLANPLKILSNG